MPLTVFTRARAAILVTATLALCVLLAPPALARPTPPPARQKAPVAAAAAKLQDFSSRLPRTTRDEITGDFLGRGYEQHMRAEDGALNIYDPPALGGALQRTTPLDLGPVPDTVGYWYAGHHVDAINPWATYILGTDCDGCLHQANAIYHLSSVYLAYVDGSVYISGTKGDAIDGGDNDPGQFPPNGHTVYRNLLYEVPANGTCAVESCARAVKELPVVWEDPNDDDSHRPVGVTALAAGTSGGFPYVAVGMTDFGTWMFDARLEPTGSVYAGEPTGGQTPVSALAFDPGGSGMLSVGLLSPGAHSLTTQVNPDGTVTATTGYLGIGGGPNLNPFPLATTFGHRSDGSLVVAYGYNDGTVRVGDPHVLGGQELAGGTSPAGVSVMDAVPRPDGGADDYAVAMQTTLDITGPLIGTSWRWDESQLSFTQQKVSVDADGNPTTTLPTRDAYRSWFPGFKQGRFTVTNNSHEEVTVSLKTRPDVGYGCWWAGTWADAAPFPTNDLTLAAGVTSPTDYVMGGYTAHTTSSGSGTCAATDASGEWRGYLIVTPTTHPADARIVNLHLGRDWTLDVSDQTGGSTTVTARKTGQLGALGAWALTVDTPDPPTPVAPTGTPTGSPIAPTLTASVLTTPKKGRATVYRFDVAPMTWTVATAPDSTKNPSVQAVIPPMLVEGLPTTGTAWQPIGYLMPIGRLTGTTTTVTTAASTFYWENTTVATYTKIRVNAGSQPTQSLSGITLATLPPPAPRSPAIGSISAAVTTTSDGQGDAAPAANGVDQSTVNVTLNAVGGAQLPPTDPAYQSVYYRSGAVLVTNLYGTPATNPKGSLNTFVGVQPQPGAVIPQSRDNSTGSNDYVSTTSTASQPLTATIGLGATVSDQNTFHVNAANLDPRGPGVDDPAGPGFSIEGCANDFSGGRTCRIANATRNAPALFQAGLDFESGQPINGLPLIGANFGYRVFPAVSYLPIEWPETPEGRELQSSVLTLENMQAQGQFETDMFKTTDHVDFDLVVHGQRTSVTAEAGGG